MVTVLTRKEDFLAMMASGAGASVPGVKLAPSQIQLLDALVQEIQSRTALICLTGEGGAGKSTLIGELGARLPEGTEMVRHDFWWRGTDVLSHFLTALGGGVPGPEPVEEALCAAIAARPEGTHLLLVCDAAESLEPASLTRFIEFIARGRCGANRISGLVVGNQTVAERLAGPATPLRVDAVLALQPLSREESFTVLRDLLASRGLKGEQVEEGALEALHTGTQGNPRLLRSLLRHCLTADQSGGPPRSLTESGIRAVLTELVSRRAALASRLHGDEPRAEPSVPSPTEDEARQAGPPTGTTPASRPEAETASQPPRTLKQANSFHRPAWVPEASPDGSLPAIPTVLESSGGDLEPLDPEHLRMLIEEALADHEDSPPDPAVPTPPEDARMPWLVGRRSEPDSQAPRPVERASAPEMPAEAYDKPDALLRLALPGQDEPAPTAGPLEAGIPDRAAEIPEAATVSMEAAEEESGHELDPARTSEATLVLPRADAAQPGREDVAPPRIQAPQPVSVRAARNAPKWRRSAQRVLAFGLNGLAACGALAAGLMLVAERDWRGGPESAPVTTASLAEPRIEPVENPIAFTEPIRNTAAHLEETWQDDFIPGGTRIATVTEQGVLDATRPLIRPKLGALATARDPTPDPDPATPRPPVVAVYIPKDGPPRRIMIQGSDRSPEEQKIEMMSRLLKDGYFDIRLEEVEPGEFIKEFFRASLGLDTKTRRWFFDEDEAPANRLLVIRTD